MTKTNIKTCGQDIKTARLFGENPANLSAIHCPLLHFAFARTSPVVRYSLPNIVSACDIKIFLM